MDKYLKLFVSIFLWCYVSTGRTYRAHYGRPYDSHSQFHHGFEHFDRGSWHNGAPEWDPPSPHRVHINNAQNRRPIIHRNDYQESKEYWRQHHRVINTYKSGIYTTHPEPLKLVFTYLPPRQAEQLPPITPIRTDTFLQCMQSCPAPIEYNPVCGTNNVTYVNPTKLECAKRCGLRVELQLKSRCPSIYTLQIARTQIKPTPSLTSPIQTELSENEEEYWTDIPLKEPDFFYIDHTEPTKTGPTRKNIFDISKEPTRTPFTEFATSKPGHLQTHKTTTNPGFTLFSQGTKVMPDVTRDAIDEDENFDIDVRFQSFD